MQAVRAVPARLKRLASTGHWFPRTRGARTAISGVCITLLLVALLVCVRACAAPPSPILVIQTTHYHHAMDSPIPPPPLDDGLVGVRATDGHILWRRNFPGEMLSAPVAANGMVYVAAQAVSDTFPGDVYAFRVSDGAQIWRYQMHNSALGDGVMVVGQTLYICPEGGAVWALDTATGHLRWRVVLSTVDNYGLSCSVADGMVYASGTTNYAQNGVGVSTFFALRASDGKQMWALPGFFASSGGGGVVYLDNPFTALDASNGTPLWQIQDFNGTVFATTPQVAYAVVGDGAFHKWIVALPPRGAQSLWVWRNDDLVDGSLLAGSVIYSVSSSSASNISAIYALRASDGHVLWQWRIQANIGYPPALAEGMLYTGADDGYLYVVRASDGKQIARYHVAGSDQFENSAVAVVVPH